MGNKLLSIFSWAMGERHALRSELETIWESRSYGLTREQQIVDRIKALDAKELDRMLPARAVRGY